MSAKATRRRAGRPPAGIRPGEQVTGYEPFTLRLPPDVKARLQAASSVLGQPMWRIVNDAIAVYLGTLSRADRELVTRVANRRPRKTT